MTAVRPAGQPASGVTEGEYPELRLLIDGRWLSSAVSSPVVDPATEEVIAEVPHATTEDIDAALDSAARGFATWRRVPAAERAAIIREAARLVGERADHIAGVITRELGKPLAEARAEVRTAIGILEWNADEGRRTYGRVIPVRRIAGSSSSPNRSGRLPRSRRGTHRSSPRPARSARRWPRAVRW